MKQIMKVWTYVLVCMFVGSITSCNDDPTPDSDNKHEVILYLEGAWREDGSKGVFVFDGGGTFKFYEDTWQYTTNADSYSSGIWNLATSPFTLTLTYTDKYVEGNQEQNFQVSTTTLSFKNFDPYIQAITWNTGNGSTITFQRYMKTSVEQYLRNWLIGQWESADKGSVYDDIADINKNALYNIKADETFTRQYDSIEEYGVWSVSNKGFTMIVQGYYDTKHNKVAYDNPHIEPHDAFNLYPSSNTMECYHSIDVPPMLDQGGGGTIKGSLFIWSKSTN